MPRLLTQQQQRQFAADGLIFPVRVLNPHEAVEYSAACEVLEKHLGGRPRTVEVRQMHLHFAWAHRLATHPQVLDAVEDLLGPNLVVWATELFAKHSQDATVSIAWHRDGAYMGLDPERTVTAWIALTGSSAKNGCMQVIREANRRQQREVDSGEDRHAPARARCHWPSRPDGDAVSVELHAGEMSLHDVHVLHGSGPNMSDQKRVGFAVRFTTPETRPALDRPPAILARGEDRWNHFLWCEPPLEDCSVQALAEMRLSARRHLEATLINLRLAST